MEKQEWNESKCNVRTYLGSFEDEMIHIIKTGFINRYLVVWEDAHDTKLGKIEEHTLESIFATYGIDLEEPPYDYNGFPDC